MLQRFRRHLVVKEGEGSEPTPEANPIHQVLALATRLPRHFIVRRNDGRSTEFVKRIESIETSIEIDDQLNDVTKICDSIDECVQQFAQAQTQQIDETLDSFGKALEELVDGLDKTVVDQGVRLIEIQKIKTGLGRVDGTNTLEEIKEILAAGIAEVSKLVDRELEIQRELRKVHDQYKGRLWDNMGRMESEPRVDLVTKIAGRGGIDKHFKAVCDHARTNGSSYTFALVNLEGGSTLSLHLEAKAADNALAAFAQRLQAAVGGAFIGRLGGDDFVVIGSADETLLFQLLSRLVERLTVHPVGGLVANPPILPSFAICKIEPSSAIEQLVSECALKIQEQRYVSMAA